MRIQYEKLAGTVITFTPGEIKLVLAILRGVYKSTGAEFIARAIEEIESDMKPKQLPFTNHFHFCDLCMMEVDDKTDNALHVINERRDVWVHKSCQPLKQHL